MTQDLRFGLGPTLSKGAGLSLGGAAGPKALLDEPDSCGSQETFNQLWPFLGKKDLATVEYPLLTIDNTSAILHCI